MAFSISARHIVKRYGGVLALSDGSLEVSSGEVVALMGANGSGKSTLSKVITGVVAPNEGQLLINNKPTRFSNPLAAKRLGIAAVYQELSLIPDMTVVQNIFLTHELTLAGIRLRDGEMRARARDLLALFAGTISAVLESDALVTSLSPGERQIVEILKAISTQPQLLILDEATASLDSQQVNRLFDLIKRWKSQGMAIVFVSHRMEEIFRIADRATVVRNGKTVYSERVENTQEHELIRQMIGDTVLQQRTRSATTTPVTATANIRLKVESLSAGMVRGVSLQLHDGELLGLGGLQEQGQTDLLLALFGAIAHTGKITFGGIPASFAHPAQAIRHGIAFVPGDRAREGLMLTRSILDNLVLPSWRQYGFPLRIPNARSDATKAAQDLNVVMAALDAPVNSLSGGNAQKVVIGKWLMRNPKLLLLNDPTKGVDVGTKSEFYSLLDKLRAAGTAILFYSSDDEELLSLCDRVLVLQDGHESAELKAESLNHAQLIAASMGVDRQA